ncbi:hypothetical protein [Stenotrophomonas maltophilia]|uniref:hypothetical protein n=1 Tax=Stenotrophomonas maltophilia TaxID=40324 RepID=UPI0022F3DA14|nr:hypothetical protein [Stenotrophomonas maltophilia]MDA5344217.1 hypothetical protein [Stenotrophomonas maltophilia]
MSSLDQTPAPTKVGLYRIRATRGGLLQDPLVGADLGRHAVSSLDQTPAPTKVGLYRIRATRGGLLQDEG